MEIQKNRNELPLQLMGIAICIAVSILIGSLAAYMSQSISENLLLFAGLGLFLLIIPIFITSFRSIHKLLFLIGFLLPIEGIPGTEQLYQDMDLTTPLLLVALLYFGLIILKKKQFRLRHTPLDIPILLFIVSQIIIIVISPWLTDTLIRYTKYNKVFILYYLFVNYLRSKENIATIVKLYVSSAILVSVYGLTTFVVFSATGQQLWGLKFKWGYLPRIYGTMRDQNIFAAYMITPLLLLLTAFLLNKTGSKKTLLIAAAGSILLAILFTWSRSGFLGLAVAGLTYLLLNYQFAKPIIARVMPVGLGVLLVIGLIATMIGYSPMLLVKRFTGDAYGTDQSDQMHKYIAKLGIEVFEDHPWGVGRSNILRYVGTVSAETRRYFEFRGMNAIGEVNGVYQGWPMHSSWLEILVAEGLIGFIAFLFVVGKTIHYGIRMAKCTSDLTLKLTLRSFVAGFVGILAAAIFYTFDWMYFFWFIIAMIMVISFYIYQIEIQQVSCDQCNRS